MPVTTLALIRHLLTHVVEAPLLDKFQGALWIQCFDRDYDRSTEDYALSLATPAGAVPVVAAIVAI